MNLTQAAHNYISRGFSVVPVKADKTPAIAWKEYQSRAMVNGEVEKNFALPGVAGLAVITGEVSGGLEVIDIDCKYDLTNKLFDELMELVTGYLPDLVPDLLIAKTINKGYHLYYRCPDASGNTKLANRPTLPEERKNEHDLTRVLIETRGTGGYVIAEPSPGYEWLQADPSQVPTITPGERKVLWAIAKAFDQMPQAKQEPSPYPGKSPFEDFNEKTNILHLLEKHGWKVASEKANMIHLTRPGKEKGISGTIFLNNSVFCSFSTSTPFEPGKGYNATGIYTLLECNGDFKEASRRLYSEGYGDRRPEKNSGENEPAPTEEKPTPPLPIEGMPEFIRHFINTMSGIYRTSPDYWAGAVIMATALAIGDKMELVTKYRNNAVLWGMFVGDVSNGKTEPLDACLRYFRRHDAKSIKQHDLNLAEFERVRSLTKQERENEGIDEIPPRPQCFQYLLTDTTAEGMADAHKVNTRGILINRDELKGWIDDFGRYSKSGEQSNMLSMWSQKGVTYNRKTSGILNIEKPVILVGGGIHRELLFTLANDNRAENGFLARMVAFFPDHSEKQLYCNEMPDPALLDSFDDFIKLLTEVKETKTLVLTDTTAKLYEAFYNDNVRRINAEPTAYLKGIFGKLDIIVLRIAIVLRAMNFALEGIASPGILPREMEAAIQITEYFRATALKVYNQIYGGQKFGKYSKEDISVWLAQNTEIPKALIAQQILKKDRRQLYRLIEKN